MDIPGFIDLQVNGYKGIDFSSADLTKEQFIWACKELVKAGTVGFLPTLITSSEDVYRRNLRLIGEAMGHKQIKESVLGIHLEGPFISKQEGAVGAHNPKWVKKPDVEFLERLMEWSGGNINLLTIAAEVEGADGLCKHAEKLGITVSLGHQMAAEADLRRLAHAGAQSLTHLGNGIPHLLQRHNNPLLAGIANDDLTAMIISDGFHIPPSVIKIIIRTKGVSNVAVVSDASPIAGLSPGKYQTLGNDVILEESGLLHNPETGYLVGSSSTMIDCMNFLLSLDSLSLEELFELGFYNPLGLIGIDPELIKNNMLGRVEKRDEFTIKKQGVN